MGSESLQTTIEADTYKYVRCSHRPDGIRKGKLFDERLRNLAPLESLMVEEGAQANSGMIWVRIIGDAGGEDVDGRHGSARHVAVSLVADCRVGWRVSRPATQAEGNDRWDVE